MLIFDRKSLLKRVIAFVLVMTLVLSSTADLIPGISLALAEETVVSLKRAVEARDAKLLQLPQVLPLQKVG